MGILTRGLREGKLQEEEDVGPLRCRESLTWRQISGETMKVASGMVFNIESKFAEGRPEAREIKGEKVRWQEGGWVSSGARGVHCPPAGVTQRGQSRPEVSLASRGMAGKHFGWASPLEREPLKNSRRRQWTGLS